MLSISRSSEYSMTSSGLMKVFLVGYVLCSLLSLREGNMPRALYWFAAALLTVSVLWGTG